MRRIVIITIGFVIAAIVYSCRNDKTVDFAAANAAKEYYDLLVQGQYDAFVDGMNIPERIPDSYRQQLVDNARMFVGDQQQEQLGLREVRVVNCINDTVDVAAHAFLMLCYGDSTIEEVVVPMVKRDGRWLMK
jgi:hypothetical protein